MSVFRSIRPATWGTLGLLGLMVLLLLTGRGLRAERDRLARLLDQERELRAQVALVLAEQAWLEGQLRRKLDDPQVLLDAYVPAGRVRVQDPEQTLLSDTLRLRTVALELEGVPWEKVLRVIDAFEGQTPPWRLKRFELESGLTGLEGTLRFEGLEPIL